MIQIKWHNNNEIEALSPKFSSQFKGCFGFIDGLSIGILNRENSDIRNAHNNC